MGKDTATVHQLFPDPAKEAQDAMIRYQAGIAEESNGKIKAIRAVTAYGTALLAGRNINNERRSNIDFKQWISDNKLNVGKPWDQSQERSNAMKIAELVLGNLPITTFDACPNTRPTDIMKWYRNEHPVHHAANGRDGRKRKLPTPKADKVRQAVADLVAAGKAVSRKKVGDQFGVGDHAVQLVIAAERARYELLEELDIDPKTLAPSAQAKLDIAKRAIERELRAEHAARMRGVDEEVRVRVIAEGKDYIERMKELEAKAWRDEKHWREMVQNHKPLFTIEQFKVILMCLHPDGERTANKLASAFRLFNSKKLQLTGEK